MLIVSGQRFAMLEMKAVLAELLRKYKVLPADRQYELRFVAEFVLKSEDGIKLKLEPRK
jgi:cytochrome P450 family 4